MNNLFGILLASAVTLSFSSLNAVRNPMDSLTVEMKNSSVNQDVWRPCAPSKAPSAKKRAEKLASKHPEKFKMHNGILWKKN